MLTTHDILSIETRPSLARAVRIAAETCRELELELVDSSRRVERASDWLASRRHWGAGSQEYPWPTWYDRVRTGYDAPGFIAARNLNPYGPKYFDGLFDAAAALGVSLTEMARAFGAVDPYKLAVARNFRRARR